MAPISKDTVELATIAEPIVPPAETHPKPAPTSSGHLRSDALSLEVAVKVHGSRVTQGPAGPAPHTEPFEEETSTMIVFPQGGVLRLNTAVNAGQMLVLTNLKTRQDAICRVVKVRANPNLPGYIEVEFTHPQPGYWGANFPSEPASAAHQPAPVPGPVPAAPEIKPVEKPLGDISWKPATPPPVASPQPQHSAVPPPPEAKPSAPPAKAAPPPKEEPSFISIGSQEEVQPFASATATIKPRRSTEVNAPSVPHTAHPAPISSPEPRESVPVAPLASIEFSEVEERRRAEATPAALSADSSQPIFGRFSSAAAMTEGHQAPTEAVGSLRGSLGSSREASGVASNHNWMLVAAAVAILALGLVGGIFYFRHHSSTTPAAKTTPAHAESSEPAPAPTSVPRPETVSAQPPVAAVARPSSFAAPPSAASAASTGATPSSRSFPAASAPTASSVSAANAAAAEPESVRPPASATTAAPSVTNAMVSEALNAHPSAPQRDNSPDADAAPVLTPGAGSNPDENAPIIIASSGPSLLSPSGPAPPLKSGGVVTEPKLKSSVLPVYPLSARQSNVQGDVVINTTIDKDGDVTQMKVVSGPAVLRQAALDALKRWKYEPSTLDSEPVEVQMLVTIKFRR